MACESASDLLGTPLRLHGLLARSRANGPGDRAVVWFQGCPLACPGCFNPETHAFEAGAASTVGEVLDRLELDKPVDGLTVSGGEPFAQPEALLALLTAFRARAEFSTLVFSGYTLKEIECTAPGPVILREIDALVAGRFAQKQRTHGRPLLGSANQRIHFLTGRIGPGDIAGIAESELTIDAAGRVVVTGIDPMRLNAPAR